MRRVQGVPRYRYDELVKMPVLRQGQTEDLRYNDGHVRLWLSRCGRADGEPFEHTVTVEARGRGERIGEWVESYRYNGDHPMTVDEAAAPTRLAACPNCGAQYPDFHSPVGTLGTLCNNCGWSSEEAAE